MRLITHLTIALCLIAGIVSAHEIRPAIATVETSAGGVEVAVDLNLEAVVAGIGARHSDTSDSPRAAEYDRLRNLPPEALADAFRPMADTFAGSLGLHVGAVRADVPAVGDTALSRTSTVVITAPTGGALSLTAPSALGEMVVRAVQADGAPFFTAFLAGGESVTIPPTSGHPGAWAVLIDYIAVGFEHIVPLGLDHILFVVGLFLLSPRIRPLLAQVTAFTLAHSVTLALGLFGVVRISPAAVEPLIAASIVFIAVENLFTDRLRRWRPFVVFGFGLLHGLGFAGVLAEFGLPEDAYLPALIGFNLGVEAGQLAVLAVCFLGVGIWFRHREWYRPALAMPASVAVALVGAFWFVERVV